MTKTKYKLIYTLLLASLLVNFAVVLVDTIPFVGPKIQQKFFEEKIIKIDKNYKEIVLGTSILMLDSECNNVWSEPEGFTESLYNIYAGSHSREFKKYNYPKAYLYYGISTYLIKIQDTVRLKVIKGHFDKLIDDKGYPIFQLDKVDQIPYGLTALNLYKVYGDIKYLKFCHILYDIILESTDDENIILYRQDQSVLLCDVIGMTVPFLIEYATYSGTVEAHNLARIQLEYYIENGVDKETYLPSHGINRDAKIKVGPNNWGRGIGWYLLGLSHFHHATGEFKKEYEGLAMTLDKLRLKNRLWSQFPGSSETFDASASTMFLYCLKPLDTNNTYLLNDFISADGYVQQTSGDTYGINNYSKAFGMSDLSQGFLLLILNQ
jgi:rhamnogalacturonyl hydrolase YesR